MKKYFLSSVTIYSLALALGVVPAAYAQADNTGVLALSTMDWWVIAGAFLIGVLICLLGAKLSKVSQIKADQSANDDDDISANSLQQATSDRGRVLAIFAAGGLVAGLLVGAATQFQALWALGIVGALLALLALVLLGVIQVKQSPLFQFATQEQYAGNMQLGAGTSVLLMATAIFLISKLPGYGIHDSQLQLAAGVVAGLVSGFWFGALLLRFNAEIVDSIGQIQSIRRLAGVATIALSIHVTGQIPAVPVLFLWAVFLVVLAIYCGATSRLNQPVSASQQLFKGVGIVFLIFGVVGLVSASFGYRNFSQSLSEFSALVASGGAIGNNPSAVSAEKVFTYAKSTEQFDQLLSEAAAAGRPVAVDYYADWCLDCKRMERTTLKDPTIVAQLTETFRSVKIDLTDPNDPFGRTIRKRYQVFGPPAMLFFDRAGDLSEPSPVYGYLNVTELNELLLQVQ